MQADPCSMFYKYRKRTLKTRSQTPRAYRANKIPVIHNPLSGRHEKIVRHTHTHSHNIHNSHDFTLNGALQKRQFRSQSSRIPCSKITCSCKEEEEECKKYKSQYMKERNISHEICCFLNFSLDLLVVFLQLIWEEVETQGGARRKEFECEWETCTFLSCDFGFCLFFGCHLQLRISMHMHIIAHNIFYDVVRRWLDDMHFFLISWDKRKNERREWIKMSWNKWSNLRQFQWA